MAAIQRKLVHKQFNSPMGLYSQQNVKETLDRELKAFGSDGIEVDPEITKPLNLANSAVLRAVEEEEQMKCDVACERQSRPRQRRPHPTACEFYEQYYDHAVHTPVHQQQLEQIKTQYLCHQHDITIDRDTVLKINRLATRRNLHKRDHSWPPPCSDYAEGSEAIASSSGGAEEVGRGTQSLTHSRSSSSEQQAQQMRYEQHLAQQQRASCNNNALHFAESVCRGHGIDAIREKFNSPTRIIEPTPTELRQRNKMEQLQFRKQKLQKNATNKSARVTDSSRETRANISTDGDVGKAQQTLTNVYNNMANTSSVNAAADSLWSVIAPKAAVTTSWPAAMKNDEGSGESTNIATTSSSDAADYGTPVARGFSAPETKAADENIGLVEPRRYYFEQLARRDEGTPTPKKWHSYDNIVAATSDQLQITKERIATAAINNNRQSQSLDRGRAQQQRRREQLPPLKPRSAGGPASGGSSPAAHITPVSSTSEINVTTPKGESSAFGGGRFGMAKTTPLTSHPSRSSEGMSPRVQRRAIKLATEIQICYDDSGADESFSSTAAHLDDKGGMSSSNSRQIQTEDTKATKLQGRNGKNLQSNPVGTQSVSDLEHIPLPSPPKVGRISSQSSKHKTSSNEDVGSEHSIEVQRTQKPANQTQKQQQQRQHQHCNSERIIPIELEKGHAAGHFKKAPRRDLSSVSADQLYDDACIYLRSIDLDDRTVAYIPAAITIVPSPPEEMLQHGTVGEARRRREEPAEASKSAASPQISPPSIANRATSQTPTTMPRTNIQKSSVAGSSTVSETINRKSNNKPRTNGGYKMNMPPNEAHCKEPTHAGAAQLPIYNASDRKLVASQPKKPQKAVGKANENEVAKSKIQAAAGQSQQRIRPIRPRGIYYTDGEYLYGPFGEMSDTLETRTTPTTEEARDEASRSTAATTDSKRNCAAENESQINNKAMKAIQKQQKVDCRNTIKMQQAMLPRTATGAPTNEGPRRNCEVMELSEVELQGKNAAEIAALETKYGRFQQSIAEHLRQIDTYMENAKAALNRSLPHPKPTHEQDDGKMSTRTADPLRQPNISLQSASQKTETQLEESELVDQQGIEAALPPENPLQAIARHWQQYRPLHIVSVTDDNLHEMETLVRPIVLENMPVVEQALQDLSAIKVGGTAAKLTAKYAGDLGSRSGNDGSVLQPLMRRLIAVQSKQPGVAHADPSVSLTDRKDIEGLLLVEHHVAPTASLAKRVTILENLDEADAHPGRKPNNIVLIEIEGGDKKHNVSDVIAVANDKIDDSNNCKSSADKRNCNDMLEPRPAQSMAKILAANENENFEQIYLSNTLEEDNRKITSDTSGRFGHKLGDKSTTSSNFDVISAGEVTNEHVIDVVANYEQLMQLQEGRTTAASPNATTITSTKQTQQQQFQHVSLKSPDISAASTTPIPRRRAATLTGEKPTISAIGTRPAFTVSAADEGGSERRKAATPRWQNETMQREQCQKQPQSHLSAAPEPPTPPPPPPLPPPPRAGSLPKELCKNVVSGYISTHQSQEQLVEQVIDKLQLDLVSQRQWEQLKQVKPEKPDNNKRLAGIDIETSNQDHLRDPLVEQRQPSKEFAMQQLNQQQSAILPITKSNQTPCDQQNAQSTEITIPSSNPHSAQETKPAHCVVTVLTPDKRDRRTISGRRGKLTVHINGDNKNNLESDNTDSFDTYKATYEIPSPCFKQQITWKQIVNVPQTADSKFTTLSELGRYSEDNNDVHTDAKPREEATASNQSLTARLQFVKQQSRTPSPAPMKTHLQQSSTRCSRSRSKSPRAKQASRSPTRKYPAALIEPNAPTRAASPFGLNPLDITELIDDTAHAYDAADTDDRGGELSKPTASAQLGGTKIATSFASSRQLAEFVPQVEGHNVGLLVRTSTGPQTQQLWQAKLQSVPHTTAARCNENAQIEMDNALTHSADMHYAYTEASANNDGDDGDDDVDLDYCVDSRQQHIADSDKHSIKRHSPVVPLSPSSSSGYWARADSLQSMTSERVHDARRDGIETTPFEIHPRRTAKHLQTPSVPDSSVATGLEEPHSRQRGHRREAHQQEVVLDNDSRQQSPGTVGEPAVALPRESGIINRSFDNVSPRPYNTVEGYKRVAWPPVSEERVVREFTPQPTSAHYPVSGSLPQQPAQQQQPQHLQQQQQPLQQQQQQQQNAAPANQGSIYNNVSRAVRDNSSHPYQQPQQHQPSDQQHYESLQQPIQYTQAQFNRQPSREPAGPPFGQHLNEQYGQPTPVPQYQLHNYPVEPQQPEQQYDPNSSSGWRPIRPPMPKGQSEFVTSPVGGAPFYPSHGQQEPSTPQPQHVGQDQPDHQAPAQSLPQDYRGGSPGIITLRKEAPVTQKPAPVYNAQPAAVSFQGGSNMRGDLKWPPPEYKEAAVRENEERRKLAQGPVCRPRKVNRDYTTFFAKNALNSYYPSYKVPPGTQHMLS
ncbi:uncharacterized protein LOC105213043 isoform X3 [Zeugodacus cucurbitae]|uniref:uncharacterized protein LOC105213043 isoform X3 n=1 Tax=Zeugodacus cucurbitae TaxID=28588 RepID=UPI0023D8F5A1|nr:uncharacterized protein LOC105213043 isoform X3 [Zeugodacus cucurbitae]